MNSRPINIPARIYWFIVVHVQIVSWVVHYIVARRAWLLAPLIVALLICGLLIFVSANPVLSPFLYALF